MSKMMLISSAQAQTLSAQLSTATQTVTAAASQAAQQAANPYGLGAIWTQGDWVAKLCLLLLVIMSVASWVVIMRKFLELRKTQAHTAQAHAAFDNITTVGENLNKLSADNPLRFVSQASQDAVRQFAALRPRVDYDTWIIRAIESALSRVQTRMQDGLALLATIGSTAPFVGLFGTVWAIYSALVKIGASGQASIDRVAGPVGEALIMTAIGLAVAVPAVFGYNWLLRKNKLALESMRSFGSKLHIVLLATEKVVLEKPNTPQA
jgi:biopolymer transport protein ExbB